MGQPLEQRLSNLPDWKLAYRVDEASAAIGLARTTIFQRIRDKKLAAVKDGKTTLILRAELVRYLASLPPNNSRA